MEIKLEEEEMKLDFIIQSISMPVTVGNDIERRFSQF
jgi:hypothetical protein